jgi:two-component system invasion response regulator UvrY
MNHNTAYPSKKIILSDPHHLIRASLKAFFDSIPDFEVVAETETAKEAAALFNNHNANIYIVEPKNDLDKEFSESLVQLKNKNPGLKILLLTDVEPKIAAQLSFCAEVDGCLTKCCKSDFVISAINDISKGERRYSEDIEQERLSLLSAQKRQPKDFDFTNPLALLSKREKEIFLLLAEGLQNAVIAKKLFISPRTVETHRARIVRKLNLKTNAELIRFAIRSGLTCV